MTKIILRGFVIFIILGLTSSLMMNIFNTQFGDVDYFKNHGYFFLFFITIFPRLTLLFSSVVSGGFIWWLSFIFCPRILVATLATMAYFKTNPILVVISWLVAIGGEVFEKRSVGGSRVFIRTYRPPTSQQYNPENSQNKPVSDSDTIEAEYYVKK